jgi:hypothetical protein
MPRARAAGHEELESDEKGAREGVLARFFESTAVGKHHLGHCLTGPRSFTGRRRPAPQGFLPFQRAVPSSSVRSTPLSDSLGTGERRAPMKIVFLPTSITV